MGSPSGLCRGGARVAHQTLYYGDRFTVIRNPKDELKTGTYYAMLKQLDVNDSDL
jgi:mRNA interferase HicA